MKDINEQREMYEDIIKTARDGLKKIKLDEVKTTSLMESYENAKIRVDYGASFYDPYNSALFESKVKIDMLYFEQLCQKLDNVNEVTEKIGRLYNTVREIYEHINICPEVYGRLTINILNESIQKQQETTANIIYEFVNNKYYKMTPEQRQKIYLPTSKPYTQELIAEGVDPSQAIVRGIKTVMLQELLSRIAFPVSTWYRVNYLLEDSTYGKVFDQSTLIDLVENFRTQVEDLSKNLSLIV